MASWLRRLERRSRGRAQIEIITGLSVALAGNVLSCAQLEQPSDHCGWVPNLRLEKPETGGLLGERRVPLYQAAYPSDSVLHHEKLRGSLEEDGHKSSESCDA